MRPAIVVVFLAVLLAVATWASGFPPAAYAGAWVSGVSHLADGQSDLVVKIKKKKNQDGGDTQSKQVQYWCCYAVSSEGKPFGPYCGYPGRKKAEAEKVFNSSGYVTQGHLKLLGCQKDKSQ